MVRPAADRPRLALADLGALLAPFPGRAEATTRIAVASTLTVLIAAIYGTPEAAISAYVIFFIHRADRTGSIVLSLGLLVLVSLIVGLVMVLADLTLDHPMLRVACMAVLSAGLLFLTSASKLRPVGAIVAMVVGFGLDQLGLVPAGELATRALLYAWLMVAIAVGANVVVNLLMGPSPRRLAGERLAHCLRVVARSLREPAANGAALATALRDGVQPLPGWLKLARFEGSASAADVLALRQAMTSTMAILMAADVAWRQPQARLPAACAATIADTLEAMARMLAAGGYPVEIALALPDAASLPPLQQAVAQALRDAIEHYAEPGAPAAPDTPHSGPHGKSRGFMAPDALTNPAHVHYALKTTGAAMFCYLLYQQLNWPGIHTCFITCYLVALGTAAESVEKLTLRLAGCLVGAAAGTAALVYIVPALDGVSGLLALVFAGTWLSAWVASGSPRIAYAGFQIAFAFYLCVIQGPGPGFDLSIARDRVIGILIGNLVVYLVFTRIWPVSIAGRIEAALAALASQWQQLIDARQPASRREHAAGAMALRENLAQDLALARYEPASVGPAPAWLAQQGRRLKALDAVAGPLFLLAERYPGDPALAARLHAVRTDQAAPADAARQSSPADGDRTRDTLLALVDQQLSGTRPGAAQASSPHAQT
ncbi:FUSC family protein [Cupriavidus neocaledonicus]|uniref:Multidrug resistance protein MdtO n=1 Tax=Cupriavidus neocaledonicus TaxID=1040979 RepID=A0A375H3S1_9BURK|nr:FUSC family protein [Cupriavidus neocaledonicus]SOZ34931.1 Multidrug resistance protein MdtO [Cupriavidus neocaledonicus]SPD46874.1 Multidrug resistance protein MdtO [Cupriavidus neocaledonicus]